MTEKDQLKVKEPEMGICLECKKKPAVVDYNGHHYYVCESCNKKLNDYFDEEYD